MFNLKHFMLVTCSFLLPAQTIFSQIVLQGTVSDNGGEYLGGGAEPVVNALVTVTDQSDAGRFFTAYTNDQGQYTIQITQTGVDDDPSATPGHFRLLQNYPNPFNPSTVIGYELLQPCRVTIDIYNVLGRKIKTLLDGFQSSSGQVVWDATDNNNRGVTAGLYIYSMKAGDVKINKKMLLIDGQQGNAPATSDIKALPEITGRLVLNKQMSDQYTLQITGEDIATYEEQNLEITSNMTYDATVIRTVMDIDGNVYRTVKIGNQWWLTENLKVTHYRNSDPIPNITSDTDWGSLTIGAYCDIRNDTNEVAVYGRLYNGYSVNDSRNIAPAGWHVPSDGEWKELELCLGMSQAEVDETSWRGDVGGKLKDAGTGIWLDDESVATNLSGFCALPAGYRMEHFSNVGDDAHFWSATEYDSSQNWQRVLTYGTNNGTKICRTSSWNLIKGSSVRCVRD